MQRDKISPRDLSSQVILFILGSALVTSGNSLGKQDSWIALIVAMIVVVPIFMMYARICTKYPENDIFEIFYLVFGKAIGMILTVLFTLYAISLSDMVIRNFTEFIQTVSLTKTPQLILAFSMGAVCVVALKSSFSGFGRVANFVMALVTFTILLSVVLSFESFDLSYIKPIASNNLKGIFEGAMTYMAFPLGEVVLFMTMCNKLRPGTSTRKVLLISLLIGGGLLVISVIRNILVLGPSLMSQLYFPSFSTLAVINISDFISRIEVIVAGNFLICGVIKVYVCTYAASIGIKKLFNLTTNKDIVSPLMLLIIALSGFMYKSTMQMILFIDFYKYYAAPFQLIIPLITLVVIELKSKKNKKTQIV